MWFDGPALPDAISTGPDNSKDDSNDACSDSDETTTVHSTDVDADGYIHPDPSDDAACCEESSTDSEDVEREQWE